MVVYLRGLLVDNGINIVFFMVKIRVVFLKMIILLWLELLVVFLGVKLF